jgi:hypothetical protein
MKDVEERMKERSKQINMEERTKDTIKMHLKKIQCEERNELKRIGMCLVVVTY